MSWNAAGLHLLFQLQFEKHYLIKVRWLHFDTKYNNILMNEIQMKSEWVG